MKYRCLLLGAFAVSCGAASLAPWTIRSDFESGMRQGWESYPLAQDAGYEPTLDPVQYKDRKALERHSAPTRDGIWRLGFVRKVRAAAGGNPQLKFFYAVPSSGATHIEIRVFSGDKPRVLSIAAAKNDGWTEASLSLPTNDRGAEIRAISITAIFPEAREGREERFLIDDVRISAMRERDLPVSAPASIWDEDRRLHYVRRSYTTGEELRIEAPQAKVRLFDPTNQLISEEATYRFTSKDKAGMWRAELKSSSGSATMLLLLKPNKESGLLFDDIPPAGKDLLDVLHQRVTRLRTTIHPELGPNIIAYNDRWLLPGLPSYFNLLQPPSEAAVLEALQYRHTGNEESLSNARKILLSMAAWPTWIHPWFPAHGYRTYYPVGIVASHLALATDLIRSKLSQQEVEMIERGLAEKSVIPAFDEYVLNDRIIFHTSNWIGHAVGGALLAALEANNPDLAGYALGLFTKLRDHIDATYTADGSYGEGASYMKFDMQTSSLAAAASKRRLGQNIDAPLIHSWKHLLYAFYGSGEALDHGDSHASIRPFGVYAYAASQNSDPTLSRTYLDHKDSGGGSLLSRLLWEGSIHTPKDPPVLPRSAVFPIRGNATFRSGWSPEATVINMRAAANFNHNHADQGSLSIAHRGELLIDEAGYSDYYKDPFYRPYVIQALGHNTLLIDADPESQRIPDNRFLGDYPKIIQSSLGDEFDAVRADLTPAYGDRLERYTRTLIYRKNGAIIVIDRVKSQSPHRFSVIWHPASATETQGLNPAHIHKNNSALDLQVLGSIPLQESRENAPLLLNQFEKSEKALITRPVILSYAIKENSPEAVFVSVLRPRGAADSPEAATWTSKNGVYELKTGNLAVRIDGEAIDAVDGQSKLSFPASSN